MANATHGIRVTRKTDTMQVVFELFDKAKETVEDTLTIDWSDVHEDCKDFCSLYGVSKILMDRDSGVDMLDKLDAYDERFSSTLKVGILEKARTSSGPTVKIEIEALAKLKGITVKQAQTLLRKYSKDQQEVILSKPEVTKIVAQLKKDTEAESEVDFDDLL